MLISHKVYVPTQLRSLTGGLEVVETIGATVQAVIDDLEAKYPGIKERICKPSGEVSQFINIFVGQEDIRNLLGRETTLSPDEEISIIPAMAGG